MAATKAALRLGDYVVTEAGFGADLGAEKFLDIKCRGSGLRPDAVVIVATVRALKLHGGADKTQLATEDTAALRRGIPNLLRHIENITQVYGLPAVVALNRFTSDTAAELALVQEACAAYGAEVALSEVWELSLIHIFTVYTHELGHGLQGYLSYRSQPLADYVGLSPDLAEVHSKTMELLTLPYARDFFGPHAPQFLTEHRYDFIKELCAFCSIHTFETWLYAVSYTHLDVYKRQPIT